MLRACSAANVSLRGATQADENDSRAALIDSTGDFPILDLRQRPKTAAAFGTGDFQRGKSLEQISLEFSNHVEFAAVEEYADVRAAAAVQ